MYQVPHIYQASDKVNSRKLVRKERSGLAFVGGGICASPVIVIEPTLQDSRESAHDQYALFLQDFVPRAQNSALLCRRPRQKIPGV